MVCSIGTVGTLGVVTVIPFTNNYASLVKVHSSELLSLSHAKWAWWITLVIGTDRNMHMAYWYPTGAAIAADVDFITEETTNKFFSAATPPLLL